MTDVGALRVEEREIARTKRGHAAVLAERGAAAELHAEQKDIVVAVRDMARRALDAIEAATLKPHEAEFAQLHAFDRGVELGRRRDAAVVLDDRFTSEVVPIGNPVARMDIGQCQERVYCRLVSIRERKWRLATRNGCNLTSGAGPRKDAPPIPTRHASMYSP